IDWRRKTARIERARTFRGTLKDVKNHEERDVDLSPRALAAPAPESAHAAQEGRDLPHPRHEEALARRAQSARAVLEPSAASARDPPPPGVRHASHVRDATDHGGDQTGLHRAPDGAHAARALHDLRALARRR